MSQGPAIVVAVRLLLPPSLPSSNLSLFHFFPRSHSLPSTITEFSARNNLLGHGMVLRINTVELVHLRKLDLTGTTHAPMPAGHLTSIVSCNRPLILFMHPACTITTYYQRG